ncbi:cytochrome P450 [Streptomyces sp. NPDC092296]|uniref:cytochrome P450 n=1 Tax=Streptomyces sp. NPDC092296 TaxID=3366012 RepID=UPI0037FDA709
MTTPPPEPAEPAASAEPAAPAAPVALFGPAFAADPHGHYALLRERGPLAAVEIAPGVPALLVTDYQAALEVLRDTQTFSKDPRSWQQGLPADSPVLPMLGWRPTALFSDGEQHARYRQAITDSFALIEPHLLQEQVAQVAGELIQRFATAGTADLIQQYARQLPLHVMNAWFGVPDADSDRLVAGMAGMMESTAQAAAAYADFVTVVSRLVADRRARPSRDLISWFLGHHAELDDGEVVRQLTLTMSAGHEPTTNLIGNALLRMLTDDRYAGSLFGGAMTAREAIDDVLWRDPPLANFSAHYPRFDTELHGVRLPAGQLVLVSYAAANTQVAPDRSDTVVRSGDGAHLAWAAGPHACPARQPALLIAITAIEQLTSQLCDLELAVPEPELVWRPGPFHRALAHLPVRFSPLPVRTPDDEEADTGPVYLPAG